MTRKLKIQILGISPVYKEVNFFKVELRTVKESIFLGFRLKPKTKYLVMFTDEKGRWWDEHHNLQKKDDPFIMYLDMAFGRAMLSYQMKDIDPEYSDNKLIFKDRKYGTVVLDY